MFEFPPEGYISYWFSKARLNSLTIPDCYVVIDIGVMFESPHGNIALV